MVEAVPVLHTSLTFPIFRCHGYTPSRLDRDPPLFTCGTGAVSIASISLGFVKQAWAFCWQIWLVWNILLGVRVLTFSEKCVQLL